ncbi:MAG: DUF1361 domain-containing protein [Enterococcus viikkiensis]
MKKKYLFHFGAIFYILFMSHFRETFSFMGLNVFLAWLPLVFGSLFMKLISPIRWLFAALWLLFFPNVPYLLTDLFHLESLRIYHAHGLFTPVASDWWPYFFLVLPILIMVFVGMAQVFRLFATAKLQTAQRLISLLGLAVLSGIAVYSGRFDRIHSIELIIKPIHALQLLLGNWHIEKIQFVLMFSLLQLGVWALIFGLQQDRSLQD